MVSPISLLLDEDVWPGLANVLCEHGFDVVHVYQVERGGRSDVDQLAYAAREKRAILTHNAKDFVPLAVGYFFGERFHAGIILSPQVEKGELVRCTLGLLRALSAEDMNGTVRYLADYR